MNSPLSLFGDIDRFIQNYKLKDQSVKNHTDFSKITLDFLGKTGFY
jgi:hypothetical protein